jgi:uncharacterized PurR-regulated membrane protein YhhQ (DUF165 family)
VIYIAFWLPPYVGSTMPGVSALEALTISLSSFAYKVGVAIALTPIIYGLHWLVHRWLGHDLANALAAEAAGTS